MGKQTAVEWVIEELTPSITLQQKYIDELKEQAKEMETQQNYSDEEVENLIRTTYEETMRAMVDWFIKNKDKNPQDYDSIINNYISPRLSKKGINFKKINKNGINSSRMARNGDS